MDDNVKLLDTCIILLVGFCVYGTLFLICELGERTCISFELIGDELERCDWYKLPIEMHRMYLIFLSDSQQEKNVACYFNLVLTRETFEKVLHQENQNRTIVLVQAHELCFSFQVTKKGFSYFTTFRQLEI